MTAQIVKFYPANASDDPDMVLEQCTGLMQDVLVLGYDKDGEMFAASSTELAQAGDIIWLMECMKLALLTGQFAGEPE